LTTSLTTSLPQWLAGCTYDGDSGNDLRNSDITAAWLDSGILTGSTVSVWPGVTSGAALKVAAASGMTVTVGPGSFVVPYSASGVAGGYRATLTSSGTLTVAAADTVNPRIDLVCANVTDNGNSSSYGEVQIITGTPAASPAAPAAPANSVYLAQVYVAANATSIVSGNIYDVRTFTAAAGGIPIAPKTGYGALPGGYSGLLAFDPASGSFYHMSAAGPKQMHVFPWTPQVATATADIELSTSIATILSVPITTDGVTDITVTIHWGGIDAVTPGGGRQVTFTTWIDSDQLDEVDLAITSADLGGVSAHGGTSVYTTGSVTSDTPSAGSHTVYFKAIAGAGSGSLPYIRASASRVCYLRVQPATL